MLDLTAKERRILQLAGRRSLPKWRIWFPAVLGLLGGTLSVAGSLMGRPQPDLRGIALGLMSGGFLLLISAMLAHNQQLVALIGKLRDHLGQPSDPPEDPQAVREPRPRGPGGRTAGAAVAEPVWHGPAAGADQHRP